MGATSVDTGLLGMVMLALRVVSQNTFSVRINSRSVEAKQHCKRKDHYSLADTGDAIHNGTQLTMPLLTQC